MFSKMSPLRALQHVAQNCSLRMTEKIERITANFGMPPPRCSSHAQQSKERSASTMKQGSTQL